MGDNDFETVAGMSDYHGDVKAWHPEEELLASGNNDVGLWREDDGWGSVEVRGRESTVWGVEWENPLSSGSLCSCSDDMTIRLWSDSSGWREETRLLQRHERPICAAAWKNDRVVSTRGDGRLLVNEEWPIRIIETEKPKRDFVSKRGRRARPISLSKIRLDRHQADRSGSWCL